ncbi:MAG: aspartate ammonia-lyase [Candidatus Iainarchaeum archaeon]|uniref:Aspartate ammonia-lyase n=1 Tax=Candidatus Iainarchaeum sp. TaxID=3101447 RepID=A0A7T9DKC1_9ARCH|nr:MAG: aspartate ammonia-lyase [Candidatus Diapherotrites archaeon]
MRTRKEMDALGVKNVPAESFGGIFSVRAKENFHISWRRFPTEFFTQLAHIKHANALVHMHGGRLGEKEGKAIVAAAKEVAQGKFAIEFGLDVFQAGAGTPLNMTMNEVIANRALDILGERKGKYARIHPNNHVNMAQCTNDVIPSAIRMACVEFSIGLEDELQKTITTLQKQSKRYAHLLKVGRTHLQAAVPITFGQELSAHAEALKESLLKIKAARAGLMELPLGGTAIGTGITTEPGDDVKVIKELRKIAKRPYTASQRKFFLTSHMSALGNYSHALSELASEGIILCNDLVLLGSDPLAGIGEVKLPEVEPGSSIMPGKVNPSIVEAFKMVCLQVQGHHETIRLGMESTQLELNVMTPILAADLFESQFILHNSLHMLREKCLRGLKPTPKMQQHVEQSLSFATVLNPYLGYEVVAHFVKKGFKQQQGLEQLLVAENVLTPTEISRLLNPRHITQPQRVDLRLKEAIQSRAAYRSILQELHHYSK